MSLCINTRLAIICVVIPNGKYGIMIEIITSSRYCSASFWLSNDDVVSLIWGFIYLSSVYHPQRLSQPEPSSHVLMSSRVFQATSLVSKIGIPLHFTQAQGNPDNINSMWALWHRVQLKNMFECTDFTQIQRYILRFCVAFPSCRCQ